MEVATHLQRPRLGGPHAEPTRGHDAWEDGNTVWSKGERVSTGQWFGVTDASEVLQADWNMKGVLCLNMCIMAGLMDKDDRTVAAGKREVSAMRALARARWSSAPHCCQTQIFAGATASSRPSCATSVLTTATNALCAEARARRATTKICNCRAQLWPHLLRQDGLCVGARGGHRRRGNKQRVLGRHQPQVCVQQDDDGAVCEDPAGVRLGHRDV